MTTSTQRKIRYGMIGGGEGAFIGAVHRMAAALDGEYALVCGAFSSDSARNLRSAEALHLDSARAYPTLEAMLAGLALQAAMIVLYLFVRDVAPFYGLAIVFGVAYGGVMPLYALVTREYFGEKVMGAAYGGVFLVSTLGMGIGSFAGGVLYDRLGSYAWLYGGSFAIGLVAVVLALTFRPPRLLPGLNPVLTGR
jgi:MFS family permease